MLIPISGDNPNRCNIPDIDASCIPSPAGVSGSDCRIKATIPAEAAANGRIFTPIAFAAKKIGVNSKIHTTKDSIKHSTNAEMLPDRFLSPEFNRNNDSSAEGNFPDISLEIKFSP